MKNSKSYISIIAGTALVASMTSCYRAMPINGTSGNGREYVESPSYNKNNKNDNQRPPMPSNNNNDKNNNGQRPPMPSNNNYNNSNNQKPSVGQIQNGVGPQIPSNNNNYKNDNEQRPPVGQTQNGVGPQNPSNNNNSNDKNYNRNNKKNQDPSRSGNTSSTTTIHANPGATTRSVSDQTLASSANVMPHVTIYKTKNDYSNNVPVILDETGTKIVSYPDPKDINENSKPTELSNGYLLDNRGIGQNVAFTSYTYDEYSKLSSAPSTTELMNSIIDSNPLTSIVDCGSRTDYSENLVSEVNNYIKKNKLK